MDQDVVKRISNKVAKQFPELKGKKPTVRQHSKSAKKKLKFEFTYKGKVELPGGRRLPRIVRVVADEKGKIIRMSTSK
jgi:hypothetical protein